MSRPKEADIVGELGPTDAIEVRWSALDSSVAGPAFQDSIEAAFLWDARPVGDLLRMRMAHADAEASLDHPDRDGTRDWSSAVYAIPGLVSTRWEGTGPRREWVALIDPPLAQGDVSIEVDFWRASPSRVGRSTLARDRGEDVGQVLGPRGIASTRRLVRPG